MSELERIVKGPQSLASALIAVARDELPPAQAPARALAIMGISAVSASVVVTSAAKAAVSASALKSTTSGVLVAAAKWSLVGVSAAVLSVGVARQYQIRQTGNAVQASSTPMPATARRLPQREEPSRKLAPAPSAPSPVVSGATRGNEPRAKPSKASEISEAPVTHSLAEEVAALDKVRAASHSHNAALMLKLLDDYQRDFPKGSLGTEAQVLLVEALVQSGQTAAALPLARQLLNAAPSGPHASRIRALLPQLAESTNE